MIKRTLISFGVSATVLAAMMAGNAGTHAGTAYASDRTVSAEEAKANADAGKAQLLIAQGKGDAAVAAAEAAVTLRPQIADYRVVLGQSYLKAGRFTSARDAFGDALTLEPNNAKAALNFALAQVATGDWDGARKTLDEHADGISASDRGLAMALAGNPNGAIDVLVPVVRAGGDAKARQNLALALALAGRWDESRSIVSYDLAPDQVDQRMQQWAAFAKPHSAYDQVATLLNVTPVEDQGRPVALALNAPAPVAVAATEPAPVASASATVTAPAPVAVAATPASAVEPAKSGVQFAARKEVVQPLPVASVRAVETVAERKDAPASVKVVAAKVPAKQPASGTFFVQLGAYENAAVAKEKWGTIKRRYAAFAGHTPSAMDFSANGATYYRLSVGGFTRSDAAAMCRSYRKHGGKCFVRAGAGDKLAAWAGGDKSIKLASR